MRKIIQVAATELIDRQHAPGKVRQHVFGLCQDGTLWHCVLVEGDCDVQWQYIEGPPEGEPAGKKPTLEEQAELLRSKGGSQTFVGRGHHLHEGKDK